MTKFEWERQLKRGIGSLPKAEQQRVLDYYSELFADKIEADLDEQEIISEFGNPFDVANKIIVDFYSESGSSSSDDEYVVNESKKTAFDDIEDSKKAKRVEVKSEKKGKHINVSIVDKYDFEDSSKKENRKKTGATHGIVWSLSLVVFFVLGAFGYRHPGWMVFLGAIVVASIVDASLKKNPLLLNYPVLVTIIFLTAGFLNNLWHPAWIIFVTIPLYYSIFGMFKKNKIDSKDDVQTEKIERKKVETDFVKTKTNDVKTEVKGTKPSAATIVTAIILAIVFVYIAIVVWSVVIGFFCGGIGILIGGVAALAVGIGQLVYGAATALIVLGVGLLLFGLGLIFTIGCASLFKYCSKMCKAMFGTINKMVKGGAQ